MDKKQMKKEMQIYVNNQASYKVRMVALIVLVITFTCFLVTPCVVVDENVSYIYKPTGEKYKGEEILAFYPFAEIYSGGHQNKEAFEETLRANLNEKYQDKYEYFAQAIYDFPKSSYSLIDCMEYSIKLYIPIALITKIYGDHGFVRGGEYTYVNYDYILFDFIFNTVLAVICIIIFLINLIRCFRHRNFLGITLPILAIAMVVLGKLYATTFTNIFSLDELFISYIDLKIFGFSVLGFILNIVATIMRRKEIKKYKREISQTASENVNN